MQEVTVSLAAAKDISMDAVVVLSRLVGVFTLRVNVKDVFALLPTGTSLANHHRKSWPAMELVMHVWRCRLHQQQALSFSYLAKLAERNQIGPCEWYWVCLIFKRLFWMGPPIFQKFSLCSFPDGYVK